MVKVECTDSGDSSDVEILGQTVPLVGSSGSKPCSGLKLVKEALQKSSPDASNSLDEFSSFDGEEGSPLEFTTDDSEENQELNVSSNVDLDKKSYLLTMDFSEEEVDLAISHLGENAPLTELVDFIVTAQSESFPGQKEMNASCSGDVGKNEILPRVAGSPLACIATSQPIDWWLFLAYQELISNLSLQVSWNESLAFGNFFCFNSDMSFGYGSPP